ncbi:uncharacterized protein Z518_00454 [Rhinocladiella mackenziei CBS 650.93]|uniref:Multiple myeloma tumor-associated protein 2-like N-terminal domain-containing protein n=1 Tax=Rhinocladiella mackenziei CBS 650.93 TaxID=1442369 RepID=A0A0D2JIY3_9EURO|nr:uncharacterized protein Z518_00454 [Rhinocladiella mackenziei CBS 650.93]KIX09375.1 hypothetical protein Z518_00454 [Rhinocladiella mackenziei CBS 650.93]
MDLLATVRKEGSRGGRGEFKWSDVETSSHRENYLGHSLMAPVGRWQKGRDLNWYAKAGAEPEIGEDAAAKAARERREEIQRVKQAEEDALASALGLPVAPRGQRSLDELGAPREVGKVVKETPEDDDTAARSRSVGYGRLAGMPGPNEEPTTTERTKDTGDDQEKELQYALKEYHRRHGDRKRRSRSGSRDRIRDDDDHKRRYREDDDSKRRRHGGHRHRERRPRSPDRYRDRYRHRRERSRSRSPAYRRHGHYSRWETERRYETR